MIRKKDIQLTFDFDDTLVITSKEYEMVNVLTAQLIAQSVWGHVQTVQEIIRLQRSFDLALVKQYGFVPARYFMSWQYTYEQICKQANIPQQERVKKEIAECVNQIFTRQLPVIPESIPTLEILRKEGYLIDILTAGEEKLQKRRIRDAGIEEFVNNIYVYTYKTPDSLREVLRFSPASHHVMIGNSLKSDIYPALENGIYGFHVERETWEVDHFDIDVSNPKYVHLKSLTEVPNRLDSIFFNKVKEGYA